MDSVLCNWKIPQLEKLVPVKNLGKRTSGMYAAFEFTYWTEDGQTEVKIHFSFQEGELVAIITTWQNN